MPMTPSMCKALAAPLKKTWSVKHSPFLQKAPRRPSASWSLMPPPPVDVPSAPSRPATPSAAVGRALDVRNIPPAPRLVGIELNPGPPRRSALLRGVTAAGVALGRALAKKTKKARPARRKASQRITNSLSSSRRVDAPLNRGVVSRIRSGTRTHTIAFNCNSLSINSAAASSPFFAGAMLDFANQGAYGLVNGHIDLYCASLKSGTNWTPRFFGPAVLQVARCYNRYRVKRLRCTFIPLLSPQYSGSIAMGWHRDPFDYGATTSNFLTTNCYAAASARSHGVSSPVWQEVSFDVPGTNEWLYCNAQLGDTDSVQRLMAYGNLAIGFAGVLGPSGTTLGPYTAIGILRVSGEIEFQDLQSPAEDDEFPPPAVRAPPSEPVPKSVIERLVEMTPAERIAALEAVRREIKSRCDPATSSPKTTKLSTAELQAAEAALVESLREPEHAVSGDGVADEWKILGLPPVEYF